MGFGVALLIAFGLAMDAFAVSVASGVCVKRPSRAQALVMAAYFGGFQMLMPLAGWAGGLKLRGVISGFDHWIAFALLMFVGLKMVYESFHGEDGECSPAENTFGHRNMLILAVATSIDALAVGLSFSLLGVSIAMPVLVIGGVTFLLSFAGVFAGAAFGHLLEKKAEVAGGLVLMGIGVKILLDHTRS